MVAGPQGYAPARAGDDCGRSARCHECPVLGEKRTYGHDFQRTLRRLVVSWERCDYAVGGRPPLGDDLFDLNQRAMSACGT